MKTVMATTMDNHRQIGRIRQWQALAQAETKLLTRNSTQLLYALFFPLLMPVLFVTAFDGGELDSTITALMGGFVLAISVISGCTYASFYTAVSSLVNRREEAVLQRLRAGEAREGTILAALFSPGAVIATITSILATILCIKLMDLPVTAYLWLVAVGIVLMIGMCVGFALLTANFTRTAESAQITAVPFMLIAMLGAGATMVNFNGVPKVLSIGLNALPTAPIAHLLAQSLAVEIDWTVVARSVGLAGLWILVVAGVGLWRLRWQPRV